MRHLIYRLILVLMLIGIQPQHTFAQTSGRVFWVAQQQAGASDANPGTSTQPWKTISRGLQDLQPGDTLMVRAGLYRERILPPRGGTDAAHRITIEAAAGEKVVISGADILTAWTQDGNAWRHPWTLSLPSYGGNTDYLLRRELVVVDGAVLKPVAAREQLAPGTFFVAGSDTAPSALYVRLPNDAAPSGHTIEAATRQPLFSPASNAQCGDPAMPGWFRLSGFTFRHAANRAQWGAICPGGEGSLIENNTVEWTNGLGILANGRNHVFRGNQTNDNGHSGIGGSCNGCLVEGNQSLRNNWKGYSVWWDAGGGKWTRTENTTIRGHVARDNSGPGIWLDGYNRNNVIENSLVSANQVAGIMLELDSTGTLIRNNVVYGTRWLMWSGSGLLSQAASGNTIVHNSFIANAGDGLWIRADPDRRGADGNNRIYNNLFVRNNARGTAYEGYEIQIEGSTYGGQDALLNARSNRLDGNVYWHGSSASSSRTFYFQPDATRPDNFRSDDLVRWRELTQGDGQARIADPLLEDAGRPSGWHLRAGSPAIGQGVQPPVAVPVDLDQQVRPAVAADVGADQYASTPSSGTNYTVDQFSRSVTDGWGSAETGGAYSVRGVAADFDVTGSTGTMNVPVPGSPRSAVLESVSALNVDATFRVQTNKLATGTGAYAYLIARRVSSTAEYRGLLRFTPSGTVTLRAARVTGGVETVLGSEVTVPGLTHSPNSFVWLRVQVSGANPTTLRLKAWADGQAEPASWHYSVTNAEASLQTAGAVGLRANISSSSTNAPVLFTFDDFSCNESNVP